MVLRRIKQYFSYLNGLLNNLNSYRTRECVVCHLEAFVLHRVAFLEYFCSKQGHDFKPLAAPLYPNMGQVPPPSRVSQGPAFANVVEAQSSL